MIEENPTPMATHRSGMEMILLRSEVGRDKGKNIDRDAVDANE
jgi:hypothetical protein